MSYGARRKGSILPTDERQDPTVIPSSSFLGFLERFPWRIGKRGIRYRPSGADLQENPGGVKRGNVTESEPLLEGSDESDGEPGKVGNRKYPLATQGGRQRSATESSRDTSNSMSSRGDLFPSDDEEDAIPLDDEFAMALAPRFATVDDDHRIFRRSTSGTSDSKSTSKSKGKGRRSSTRTKGSQSPASDPDVVESVEAPTMEDMKREEERLRVEEEIEIEHKRRAAGKLARQRGLSVGDGEDHDRGHDQSHDHMVRQYRFYPNIGVKH